MAIAINQTGVTVNNIALMRLELRFRRNRQAQDLTLKQLIDFRHMPRVGERIQIVINEKNVDRSVYVGVPNDVDPHR
ncbi:hypothetical protein [Paraburkholderia susongensis]|uniref:hypothetical protein n=1 Tax=Paraburkholderia susongensis TaxID=1515439 RepID=UPI00118083AE|nr:hypothetical protein [Paraburkholderia susongensis]